MDDNLPYLISAISILFALLGTLLNLVLTRPYVGAAFLSGESFEQISRKMRWAKMGSILVAIGTLGQLISIIAFFLER